MSYSLPLRNPPRFGHHKHFRAEVAYVFTATTAICIGLLPVWGCEEFSVDCIRTISIIISPWKLLAQAEEQQPQSIATFPPLTLAGAPLCTPSAALPTWQVLQPPGAQVSFAGYEPRRGDPPRQLLPLPSSREGRS